MPELTTVAALFVEAGGAYWDLPAVDPWDAARDARRYAGPHPVVAHPPCERWGRYWGGGPSARVPRLLGHDEGCFAAALWAVRTFGFFGKAAPDECPFCAGENVERTPGCLCQWEEGDSPCPVHGDDSAAYRTDLQGLDPHEQ